MPEKDILDLDAIAPQPEQFKFGGEIITVNPPKMGDLMELFRLAEKQKNIKESDRDYEQILNETKTIIIKIIPELDGKELNMVQLLALEALVAKMGTPTQTKELTDLGINLDAEKKTADLSNTSPSSLPATPDTISKE